MSEACPLQAKAYEYQKIDAPPHALAYDLNGARFLDARSVPRTKVSGFQTLRHQFIRFKTQLKKPNFY